MIWPLLLTFAACSQPSSTEEDLPPAVDPRDVPTTDALVDPEPADAPPTEELSPEDLAPQDAATEAPEDPPPEAPSASVEHSDPEDDAPPSTETAPGDDPSSDPTAEAPPPEPATGGPTAYTLTPKGSSLYVQVFKLEGFGSGASHDHVILARGWSGSATWDPEDLAACAIDVSVPVAKLAVDPPALRASVGLEGELKASQRDKVKENMLSEGQLHGAAHPTISFAATGCQDQGDKVLVTGRMTLRGVTNTVRVPMTITEEQGRFHASGTLTLKATDYGFQPYTLGPIGNQDTMRLSVHLSGTAG